MAVRYGWLDRLYGTNVTYLTQKNNIFEDLSFWKLIIFLLACNHGVRKEKLPFQKTVFPKKYLDTALNSSFSKAKINTFPNIYYILLYQSFTPGNKFFILTFWLKGLKTESNYWSWFFSEYKWSKDGEHQVCLAFFGTT